MSDRLPFYRPFLGDAEVDAVSAVLRSGALANGACAALLEERVATLVDAPAALATASGTSGLFLALLALGIGAGDEVITSSVTCIASVNAIVLTGATPVLVDVRPDTLTLDPTCVAAAVTNRSAAIMPIHYAGQPADVDKIAAIASRNGLAVVDDAAHALGASHFGRPVGSTADLSVFSFSATKIITTGEGGMVVGRPDLVVRARTLANLGRECGARSYTNGHSTSGGLVVTPGLKCAMPDIAAAIGLVQLDRLSMFLDRRRQLAAEYTRLLSKVPELETPSVLAGSRPSWHLYTLRVSTELLGLDRDQFLQRVIDAGGAAAKQFRPAHHEPYLRKRFPDAPERLPVTERELRRNFSLPLYPALTVSGAQVQAKTVLQTVEDCRIGMSQGGRR